MDIAKLTEMMSKKKASMTHKPKALKPTPGKSKYVLLKGWNKESPETFWHDYGQHFIKDGAGVMLAVYPCDAATYGSDCPVCNQLSAAMSASGSDSTTELLKESRSSREYLVNVLALDSDQPNTPQTLSLGSGAFSAVMAIVGSWAGTVFKEGESQVIEIDRSGAGLLTKYSVQVLPTFHKFSAAVYELLPNLDEYVQSEGEAQMRKAVGAIGGLAGMAPSLPSPTHSKSDIPSTKLADISAETIDILDSDVVTHKASTSQLEELLGDL